MSDLLHGAYRLSSIEPCLFDAQQQRGDTSQPCKQVASNGPTSSGTVAGYNKFHDDKSMYTGSYAANAGMDANVRVGLYKPSLKAPAFEPLSA
jgi:hypothetical protein